MIQPPRELNFNIFWENELFVDEVQAPESGSYVYGDGEGEAEEDVFEFPDEWRVLWGCVVRADDIVEECD